MQIDAGYFVQAFTKSPVPSMIVLPDVPKFTIVDANLAYLRATGSNISDLVGKIRIESYPDQGATFTISLPAK